MTCICLAADVDIRAAQKECLLQWCGSRREGTDLQRQEIGRRSSTPFFAGSNKFFAELITFSRCDAAELSELFLVEAAALVAIAGIMMPGKSLGNRVFLTGDGTVVGYAAAGFNTPLHVCTGVLDFLLDTRLCIDQDRRSTKSRLDGASLWSEWRPARNFQVMVQFRFDTFCCNDSIDLYPQASRQPPPRGILVIMGIGNHSKPPSDVDCRWQWHIQVDGVPILVM